MTEPASGPEVASTPAADRRSGEGEESSPEAMMGTEQPLAGLEASGIVLPERRRARLVLVVDDDDMVRRLVRFVLETDELEVIEAPDGETALRLAGEADPAVVVLDIMMPGLDGVEVCRRLDHSRARVVILTARDDPDLEDACRGAGADAFLTKPFAPNDLLDVVVELLPG